MAKVELRRGEATAGEVVRLAWARSGPDNGWTGAAAPSSAATLGCWRTGAAQRPARLRQPVSAPSRLHNLGCRQARPRMLTTGPSGGLQTLGGEDGTAGPLTRPSTRHEKE